MCINCYEVTLDDRAKSRREKKQVPLQGRVALNSINMTLVRVPNIKVTLLEQICVSLIK
jgi:DNA-binding Xre family transcriptional regulator